MTSAVITVRAALRRSRRGLVARLLQLRGIQQMTLEERIEHILVSVVAIVSTWCLMHTLFAQHHAHTYFSLLPELEEHA